MQVIDIYGTLNEEKKASVQESKMYAVIAFFSFSLRTYGLGAKEEPFSVE